MLIFRYIILFWVITRIGLHASVLKKHILFPHTVQSCSSVFTVSLKRTV